MVKDKLGKLENGMKETLGNFYYDNLEMTRVWTWSVKMGGDTDFIDFLTYCLSVKRERINMTKFLDFKESQWIYSENKVCLAEIMSKMQKK